MFSKQAEMRKYATNPSPCWFFRSPADVCCFFSRCAEDETDETYPCSLSSHRQQQTDIPTDSFSYSNGSISPSTIRSPLDSVPRAEVAVLGGRPPSFHFPWVDVELNLILLCFSNRPVRSLVLSPVKLSYIERIL